MIEADRAEFVKVVMGFAELKGKQLSLPAVTLYWEAMQAWSLADFKAAASHLLRTCTFMPTPKDFEDLRKAGRPTAGEAWIEARRFIDWTLHGFTLSPNCPPLLARAIRAVGGANVIGMCDEDKLVFLERRFCEHYEGIQDSVDVREALPQIANRLTLESSFKRLTQ